MKFFLLCNCCMDGSAILSAFNQFAVSMRDNAFGASLYVFQYFFIGGHRLFIVHENH